MKILYDHQIFSSQDYGGISRYFYELARGIGKTDNNIYIDAKFSNNTYLTKLKKGILSFFPGFNFPYKSFLLFYLNVLFDGEYLASGKYDLLHPTYYRPYFLKKLKGKPYVITVYDMIHEKFAKDYKDLQNKTSEYKRTTILNASQVIAISKTTKKDLINLYGISDEKIKVIYLASSLEGVNPIRIEGLPKKYILFVGNRIGYKNFWYFIKSIAPLLKSQKDIFLICAGGSKLNTRELTVLSKLGLRSKVVYIPFNTDGELAFLYKNALVYIIPSLYEGFGMTVLEAFSMGCPVVASAAGSIPEIAGKAAYYINPRNMKSIRNGLAKVISNYTLRKKLINLGSKRIRRFKWERTISETLKVYKKAIDS